MQPPVGPVTLLTYISRDAQGHLANLNAGPLALRIRLYHLSPRHEIFYPCDGRVIDTQMVEYMCCERWVKVIKEA